MKILVTGAAGFIGSHLVDRLIDENHEAFGVFGIDDMSEGFWRNINSNCNFTVLDLRNKEQTEKRIKEISPDILCHLASNAAEGASQFQPIDVTERNLLAYINTLSSCVKNKNFKKVVLYSCHDKETHLVTTKGIKYYKDIDLSDEVYTLNMETENLEIKKIDKIIVNNYSGIMLNFRGKANLCVTPEHNILYVKSPKLNPCLKFKKAELSFLRSYIRLPQVKWKGEHYDDIFELKENNFRQRKQPTKIITEDLFYLIGLYIGDGVAGGHSKKIKGLDFKTYIKKYRDKNGKFIKVEDSHLYKDNEHEIFTNKRIAFCIPLKDKARQRLEELLDRNKFHYLKGKFSINLSSVGLADIFEQCGKNCYTKCIPRWVLNAERRLLVRLFEGLMDSDGNKTHNITGTTSKKLAEDFVELAFKINRYISLKETAGRISKMKDGRELISKPGFRITCGKEKVNHNIRGLSKTNYNGEVWCLNVENSNFLVERNGQFCFSGNSIAVYGNQSSPFVETMCFAPEDIYAINKAAMENMTAVLSSVYGFQYTTLRLHNVFGERQSIRNKYRNVIGIFMNSIMRNDPIYIYGDGNQVRSFSYIFDSLPSLIKAIELEDKLNMQVINVGGKTPVTINHVLDLIQFAFAKEKYKEIIYLPERPNEVKSAWSSYQLSEILLGYEEKIGFVNGIYKMAEWAKKLGPQEWVYKDLEIINEKTPENWIKK